MEFPLVLLLLGQKENDFNRIADSKFIWWPICRSEVCRFLKRNYHLLHCMQDTYISLIRPQIFKLMGNQRMDPWNWIFVGGFHTYVCLPQKKGWVLTRDLKVFEEKWKTVNQRVKNDNYEKIWKNMGKVEKMQKMLIYSSKNGAN